MHLFFRQCYTPENKDTLINHKLLEHAKYETHWLEVDVQFQDSEHGKKAKEH